jgi:hypothetical protein
MTNDARRPNISVCQLDYTDVSPKPFLRCKLRQVSKDLPEELHGDPPEFAEPLNVVHAFFVMHVG